jgi:hypothetical protein
MQQHSGCCGRGRFGRATYGAGGGTDADGRNLRTHHRRSRGGTTHGRTASTQQVGARCSGRTASPNTAAAAAAGTAQARERAVTVADVTLLSVRGRRSRTGRGTARSQTCACGRQRQGGCRSARSAACGRAHQRRRQGRHAAATDALPCSGYSTYTRGSLLLLRRSSRRRCAMSDRMESLHRSGGGLPRETGTDRARLGTDREDALRRCGRRTNSTNGHAAAERRAQRHRCPHAATDATTAATSGERQSEARGRRWVRVAAAGVVPALIERTRWRLDRQRRCRGARKVRRRRCTVAWRHWTGACATAAAAADCSAATAAACRGGGR